MQTADDTENFQWALARNPGANEIIHSKGINVTQVKRRESFWRFVAMALGDIAIDARPFSN